MLFPLRMRYTLWQPRQQKSWPSASYPACNTASPQWKHRVFFEALVPTAICFQLLDRTAEQRLCVLFFVEPLIEGHADVAQKGETYRSDLYMRTIHFNQSISYQWCQAFQDRHCLRNGHAQGGTPPAHHVEDMFP